MTISIRKATHQDISTLVGFLQAMALESEGIELNLETVEQGIGRVFENPLLGQYWVLEDTDQSRLAGMCLVTSEWSDWHNRFYWWYQSVYIAPEYRGRQLVQTLMQAIETAAKAKNVQEMRLYVETQNERAIRAYEKAGYRKGHYHVMQKPVG